MRLKREKLFDNEAALCASFIAWVRRQSGWEAYAETEGWDILLAHAEGTQIGVQAKMKFNMAVLEQAIEDEWGAWSEKGPDFRAVLVPVAGSRKVCGALGLVQFFPTRMWRSDEAMEFQPLIDHRAWSMGWFYWNPVERYKLPEYVPDVVAGASGPSQLTRWKVAALRVVAALELRGYVTKQDFKRNDIDHRRWLTCGWLLPAGEAGRWQRGEDMPDFGGQHPKVYPQVRDEVRVELGMGAAQKELIA